MKLTQLHIQSLVAGALAFGTVYGSAYTLLNGRYLLSFVLVVLSAWFQAVDLRARTIILVEGANQR